MLQARLYPIMLTTYSIIVWSAASCYFHDGRSIEDLSISNVQFQRDGSGVDGSHSTCCNRVNSNTCLSSGLCPSSEAVVPGHLLLPERDVRGMEMLK